MAACQASTLDERVRIPSPPLDALVAQTAERFLAKEKVAGAIPV